MALQILSLYAGTYRFFLLLATSFIVLFFLFGQYRTSMTDMSKATALSAFSVADEHLVLDGAESALQAQKLSCVEDYLLAKHVTPWRA